MVSIVFLRFVLFLYGFLWFFHSFLGSVNAFWCFSMSLCSEKHKSVYFVCPLGHLQNDQISWSELLPSVLSGKSLKKEASPTYFGSSTRSVSCRLTFGGSKPVHLNIFVGDDNPLVVFLNVFLGVIYQGFDPHPFC